MYPFYDCFLPQIPTTNSSPFSPALPNVLLVLKAHAYSQCSLIGLVLSMSFIITYIRCGTKCHATYTVRRRLLEPMVRTFELRMALLPIGKVPHATKCHITYTVWELPLEP